MKKTDVPILYTIGHSTRDIDSFIELLLQHNIMVLVDVRRFPGSRKFPHFHKDSLAKSLNAQNIKYVHIEKLGGRRKPIKNSKNTAWRNIYFRAYADYMETQDFQEAIDELSDIAKHNTTVIMCSEAVWWRCHRALISDFLKVKGWNVQHILSKTNTQVHPFTSPAKVIDQQLVYTK